MKKVIVFLICMMLVPMNTLAVGTSAKSAILMEQDTRRILYGNNIHAVQSVASISKIMTGILAVESEKMNKTVTINDIVKTAYGSGIYVKVGEKLKLEDLVYGLMLRSGNDAAVSIADYVSGSVDAFVALMNKKALELGMKDTTFNNPSGLDEKEQKGNFSSAYDMALLTSYAMQNKDYKKIVKTKKYILKTNKNTYVWHNKNKLLNTYENTTGGKTGFTKKARRTLVSTASKEGLNLIVVTLDDGNDFSDHKSLHEYGFKNYKLYHLMKKGIVDIKKETYYKGEYLYINHDIKLPLLPEEKDMVRIQFNLEKKDGSVDNTKVGTVIVKVGDETAAKENIFVRSTKNPNDVKKKSIWDKLFGWL